MSFTFSPAHDFINPLNAELNAIRHLLALVRARHFVHVSRTRVKRVTQWHCANKSYGPDPEVSKWLCENLAENKGINCPSLFWRHLKRNYIQKLGYWPVITAALGKNKLDTERAKHLSPVRQMYVK
jgi:hypothetical protein